MQMDLMYKKWLHLIPPTSMKEFYNDLVSMMEYYRQQGERLEHDFPRQPEGY